MKICLLLGVLGLLAPSAVQSATSLTVLTVYDSQGCLGKVVQNDYVVTTTGSTCTANSTCGSLSYASGYGTTIGCCTSDSSSTLDYSKKTFGDGVNTATWMIYSDTACKTFQVASDSQMTTSLATARCNPLEDGTSKKFVYAADSKNVTASQYTNLNCTGLAVNSTLQASDMGKCINLGTVGLIGYATIDGTTYGTTSAAASMHLTHTLSSVLVAACVALWHAMRV